MAIEYNQTVFSRIFFLLLAIITISVLISLFRVLRQLHQLENLIKTIITSGRNLSLDKMTNGGEIKNIFDLINSLDDEKK